MTPTGGGADGRRAGLVFVSYANEDRTAVTALIKAIKLRGVPVRSHQDFAPGDSWEGMHAEWIRAADVVLVV